jgi:hypothetical protein
MPDSVNVPKLIDLIVKNGFLAAGIVLIVVLAPLVYGIWRSRILTSATISFGLAFVVAWGVLDILQRNFPDVFPTHRVSLDGKVLRTPNNFQIQVKSNLSGPGAAYVKRTQGDEEKNKNYLFMLVSAYAPGCLAVGLNSSDPNDETGTGAYKIAPMFESDLKPDASLVAVVVPRDDKKYDLRFWREVRGRQIGEAKTVSPVPINAQPSEQCEFGTSANLFDWLVSPALAQAPPSKEQLVDRLKSDDLFARRDARVVLSKQNDAVQTAQELLHSDNYRLQLGALVALSILPEAQRRNLPPDVMARVRELKTNKDATIRETAARIDP